MKTTIIVIGSILVGVLIAIFLPEKKKGSSKGAGVAQPEVKEPKEKEGDLVQ